MAFIVMPHNQCAHVSDRDRPPDGYAVSTHRTDDFSAPVLSPAEVRRAGKELEGKSYGKVRSRGKGRASAVTPAVEPEADERVDGP